MHLYLFWLKPLWCNLVSRDLVWIALVSMNMLNKIPGAGDALAGAQKAAAEQAIKQVEEQVGGMAPGYLKIFFPCCGGPVGTMKKCEFAVPADKKD